MNSRWLGTDQNWLLAGVRLKQAFNCFCLKVTMDIGKRLRIIRESKDLSQGDIERRSGLLRSYISRVEGGYTGPSLTTLEKFARALGVEPYQLLFHNSGLPKAARLPEQNHLTKPAKKLLRLFDHMSSGDRKMLLMMASKLGRELSRPQSIQ